MDLPPWCEASPDGLLLLGPDGAVLACNRAAHLQIGGPAWRETVHPDDAAVLLQWLASPADLPLRSLSLRTQAGTFDARCQATPQGTVLSLREGGRSAREDPLPLRESPLPAREDPLTVALLAAAAGTFLYEVATATVTCDSTLLEILGLEPDEAPADPLGWLDLVHPDDREVAVASLRDCLEDGADLDLPLRVLRRTLSAQAGSRVGWLATKGRALFDEVGQAVCFTGVCVDVTASKRAEEALRDSEARFVQAQKLEAIGRMAGGIAHDFNNLLTAVNGYTELALASLDLGPEPLAEYLQEVKRAGERAAGLTAQLLAYSRRQVLTPRVVHLGGVVSDMERTLTRMLGPPIRFETRLEDASVRVRVDPGQIRQVLLHLVRNARDAMEQGGVLTVTTSLAQAVEPLLPDRLGEGQPGRDVAPGRYAVLVVRDTGHGMDDDVKSHLFEPFFTTRDQGKGTGLGLATVYGIVRQSGGHVQVSSEPGRGTEVRVLLPALDPPLTSGEDDVHATGPAATVLIAEDDDLVLQFASDALGSSGFTVLTSRTGAEALELAARSGQRIDALVTDIAMQPVDGLELAQALRVRDPQLPVVFLSGLAHEDGVRDRAVATGGLFLSKPFSSRDLVQHVRVALRQAQATMRAL